jgi:O-antigen/teichoic acid export membrane protein
MAYMGYGVWALVMQQVLNAGVNTAILWLTVGWKPKLIFSIKRLGGLISYGWKLLASALLDTVYNKLYQLVVGVFYSSSDLAYYNKADQLPLLVVENINSSIDSVLLPVLSKEQDKRDTVREMTRRAIKISTYVMMPMMAGLAACAEPLVRLLLTEKWVPCVPYMQIFCVCYAFYPLHTANLNAIKAMGRSDLFLILELIKKAVGITALLITMRMGVIYMALSRIFTGVLAQIINAYPNSKLLKYPYIQQLKDMLPAILLSTLMGFAVYSLSFLGMGDVLTLALQIVLGVVIYAVGSMVFKLDSFSYILNIIKNILHRGAAKE